MYENLNLPAFWRQLREIPLSTPKPWSAPAKTRTATTGRLTICCICSAGLFRSTRCRNLSWFAPMISTEQSSKWPKQWKQHETSWNNGQTATIFVREEWKVYKCSPTQRKGCADSASRGGGPGLEGGKLGKGSRSGETWGHKGRSRSGWVTPVGGRGHLPQWWWQWQRQWWRPDSIRPPWLSASCGQKISWDNLFANLSCATVLTFEVQLQVRSTNWFG